MLTDYNLLQNQLAIILAEMKKFAEDWARWQERRRSPTASIAMNIKEIRPLEDRPRRLFMEGTVETAGYKEPSLLDGILDGIVGLNIE